MEFVRAETVAREAQKGLDILRQFMYNNLCSRECRGMV